MSKVMENLTGVAVAAVVSLGAAQAGAAPFRVVSDGPDSVWLLDAGTGELTWCRTRAPSGPKVIDVFGAEAQAREATLRRKEASCSVVQAGEAQNPRAVRARAMLGYDAGAGYAGYRDYNAAVRYGLGGYTIDGAEGTVNVVRPRYVGIYVR